MKYTGTRTFIRPLAFHSGWAVPLFLSGFGAGPAALADNNYFQPGNLLLSRALYDNNANNVQVGTPLPPNCVGTACKPATNDGTYPTVWNNNLVDGSFGITAKIVLDQLTPSGQFINSLEVPNSSQNGVPPTKDQMVTSFSSKSEVALNLSTDGQYVAFMGYLAPIDALDVSNSNTPGVIDPTNPVNEANASHGRPSQHHWPREWRRHRHDLGRHLEGEWKRRPRRRPEQTGHDHRHLGGDQPSGNRKLHDGPNGGPARSPSWRFVHTGHCPVALTSDHDGE
jgi:hypothetical protein